MTAAYNKFNSFVQKLTDKQIAMNSDTIKVMLTNTAPVATNVNYADLVDLTTGGGYTAGGNTVVNTETAASGTVKETLAVTTFTATTGFGPFRYVAVYDFTATSSPLIAYFDYGSAVTLGASETFTVNFDQTNGFFTLT